MLVGRDLPSLEKTAGDIRLLGRQAWTIEADVGKPDECEAACQTALERHGPIDILINNVGGRRENIPTENDAAREVARADRSEPDERVLCTKLLGGAMIERGPGRADHQHRVDQRPGGRPRHRGPALRDGQGGDDAVHRAVAADWAPHRITVNAILPGGFMTEPNQRWSKIHPEVIEGFRANIPLGDFGQPEDLGPLAVYLASDASRVHDRGDVGDRWRVYAVVIKNTQSATVRRFGRLLLPIVAVRKTAALFRKSCADFAEMSRADSVCSPRCRR